MKWITRIFTYLALAFMALVVGLNTWGMATLGTITPDPEAVRDPNANSVVMVLGATGSVGDGLLKAAMEDETVQEVHVITRRMSPRIEQGVASGRVEVHMHEDFTDYSNLESVLARVNTVLWGLGTTSIGMDDDTYTRIHVDFPVSFVRQWLQSRSGIEDPMSFHYVTGMGTDANGSEHWAREKGRAEKEVAAMAQGGPLRTFGYRSGYVRPTSEQSNVFTYLLQGLLIPGNLVITGKDLGAAMLEISARTQELKNGTLIDNADSIAYAWVSGT